MTLPKLIFHYLNEKTPVVAEITPTLGDHRAWVAIHKTTEFDVKMCHAKPGEKYVVRRVELHNKYMGLYKQGNDIDYESASTYEEIPVKDELELERVVSQWVKDFDTFAPPWRSEDPFW